MSTYWVDTCGDDSEKRPAREIERVCRRIEHLGYRDRVREEALREQYEKEAELRSPTWWPFGWSKRGKACKK